MKIVQIALLAITLTAGITANAQETEKAVKKNTTSVTSSNIKSLPFTPEQTALNRTNELKSKVKLTEEQEISVKNLFLKIENRKASLASLSSEEKAKAMKDLQSVEDRELNSILSPFVPDMKKQFQPPYRL